MTCRSPVRQSRSVVWSAKPSRSCTQEHTRLMRDLRWCSDKKTLVREEYDTSLLRYAAAEMCPDDASLRGVSGGDTTVGISTPEGLWVLLSVSCAAVLTPDYPFPCEAPRRYGSLAGRTLSYTAPGRIYNSLVRSHRSVLVYRI